MKIWIETNRLNQIISIYDVPNDKCTYEITLPFNINNLYKYSINQLISNNSNIKIFNGKDLEIEASYNYQTDTCTFNKSGGLAFFDIKNGEITNVSFIDEKYNEIIPSNIMKNLKLDTSLTATFKDGSTKEYSSIEEASNNTGLSIASIKIRANKPGCGGKDKTTFKWNNEHTRKSYQARKSKLKGQNLEFEIVSKLKEIGYSNVCRSAGESKKLDNNKVDIADPSGELEVAIQAKHYSNFPNYFNIKEECPDPRDFVLIWKKAANSEGNSKGTVAIMDVEFFYKLLKIYHNHE